MSYWLAGEKIWLFVNKKHEYKGKEVENGGKRGNFHCSWGGKYHFEKRGRSKNIKIYLYVVERVLFFRQIDLFLNGFSSLFTMKGLTVPDTILCCFLSAIWVISVIIMMNLYYKTFLYACALYRHFRTSFKILLFRYNFMKKAWFFHQNWF